MKNFLVKYWALLTWLLAFLLDSKYQLLEHLISSPYWVNIAKAFGAIVLAYMTGKKLMSKDETEPDYGGGVKNPKP